MKNALTILAIDTSSRGCSAAVLKGGKIVAQLTDEGERSQSHVLMGLIEETLAQAKIGYSDCDAFACVVGPGGFTSLRVGLSVARALALAQNKPMIGIGTLEAMAYKAGLQGDVACVINAHRGQWYTQRFRCDGTIQAQCAPLLADEKGVKALSHGAKRVEERVSAADIALLAQQKWNEGEREFPISALYIREPDAKLPA